MPWTFFRHLFSAGAVSWPSANSTAWQLNQHMLNAPVRQSHSRRGNDNLRISGSAATGFLPCEMMCWLALWLMLVAMIWEDYSPANRWLHGVSQCELGPNRASGWGTTKRDFGDTVSMSVNTRDLDYAAWFNITSTTEISLSQTPGFSCDVAVHSTLWLRMTEPEDYNCVGFYFMAE